MTADENNGEAGLARDLRQLVLAVEATGRAVLPASNQELLQIVVEAAARIFGAAAASIALVDEKENCLVFRVAYGAGSEEVVGMRIGANQGIAGYVATTGQPIAVSSVQDDPRFARDTAEKTGYVPRSILAMPLYLNDRVIGVMEVLDKISAPSFGLQDMELLALFARLAAIAIEQSRQLDRLNDSFVQGIRDLLGGTAPAAAAEIAAAVQGESEPGTENDLRVLSGLLRSFAGLPAEDRRLALSILAPFAEYAGRRAGRA